MAGKLGAELGSMAGRAGSHQLGPRCTVHGQGKRGRPRDGGQAQLRVQIIREVCGDEADQGQAGKANHRSGSGSGPAIARQAYGGQGREVKPGCQSMGQDLD